MISQFNNNTGAIDPNWELKSCLWNIPWKDAKQAVV